MSQRTKANYKERVRSQKYETHTNIHMHTHTTRTHRRTEWIDNKQDLMHCFKLDVISCFSLIPLINRISHSLSLSLSKQISRNIFVSNVETFFSSAAIRFSIAFIPYLCLYLFFFVSVQSVEYLNYSSRCCSVFCTPNNTENKESFNYIYYWNVTYIVKHICFALCWTNEIE